MFAQVADESFRRFSCRLKNYASLKPHGERKCQRSPLMSTVALMERMQLVTEVEKGQEADRLH